MLALTEGMRAPPAHDRSARDLCCDREAPIAGTSLAAAKPRSRISSSISSSDSSSGDGASEGGKGNRMDLEEGNTKAPLLDKRGHRRKSSNYSGEEDGGEDSPRHQRQPTRAAEGNQSSLCGPGGLLSPRRVRVLLLLFCLVTVRMYGGAVARWLSSLVFHQHIVFFPAYMTMGRKPCLSTTLAVFSGASTANLRFMHVVRTH